MSWTEPPDDDLASIHITEVGAGKIYALPSGMNGVTIGGLTNETTYEFALVAVDENGNKSNAVHTSATPAPPFVLLDPDQNDYESSAYVCLGDYYETVTPSATFEVDTGGYVHISMTFNRALDTSSIISGQTIYFEGSALAPGTSYTAYIFHLALIGDDAGKGAVLDSNGMPLDGDNVGLTGGDLMLQLNVYVEPN